MVALWNTNCAVVAFLELKVTNLFTVALRAGVEGQFESGHVGYARKSNEKQSLERDLLDRRSAMVGRSTCMKDEAHQY
jgi:hypothetical protein